MSKSVGRTLHLYLGDERNGIFLKEHKADGSRLLVFVVCSISCSKALCRRPCTRRLAQINALCLYLRSVAFVHGTLAQSRRRLEYIGTRRKKYPQRGFKDVMHPHHRQIYLLPLRKRKHACLLRTAFRLPFFVRLRSPPYGWRAKAGIGSGDASKRAKRAFCARQGVDKMRVGASSVASFSPSIPRRVGRRTRGGIVCRAVYAVCFSDRRRWQRWRLPAALAFSSSIVFVDSEMLAPSAVRITQVVRSCC